jgi:hypothetical protein
MGGIGELVTANPPGSCPNPPVDYVLLGKQEGNRRRDTCLRGGCYDELSPLKHYIFNVIQE